jgi:magnesium transporter
VLTIQERSGDCFEGVRRRIETGGGGRIRSRGSDYLVYALLDTIVDSYFGPFDLIADELGELEEEVLGDPTPEVVERVHRARRALVGLRKTLGPHRDTVNTLIRDHHDFVAEETRVFLRDVYDHALRLVEIGEMYRDLTSDLMGMYMTVVSHRLNEVMKVLTIIATIFIPLGFIAGLYGMNFDREVSRWNMPELGWAFGYPFALGLMAAVAGGFIWYMWRRGWLN